MISPLLAAALLLVVQQPAQQTDTLFLEADDAFRMALEAAPSLRASRSRTGAADALVRQAGAWLNPVLSVTAENVGATWETTGIRGWEGIEGQAVVSGTLPLGGDRGALRSGAEARLVEARSLEAATEADVQVAVVDALARLGRDEERLRRAAEEAQGLEAFAAALSAQAEAGRASSGEAARAHLAMVSAHTVAAEAAAQAASSREQLALLLGLAPGTSVRVSLPTCGAPEATTVSLAGATESEPQPPEVAAAAARQQIAAASVAQLKAARIPDLFPQVGLRRAAGFSALYVGFSVGLPLFDRSGAAIAAATSEEAARASELDRVGRSMAAERESARQGLVALEAAGERYTASWASALDQAVLSSEARYRLGEGTLTELLDGRRARLQALDDYERWRAELFTQRARLARLSGTPIDSSLLCGVSTPTPKHTPEDRP